MKDGSTDPVVFSSAAGAMLTANQRLSIRAEAYHIAIRYINYFFLGPETPGLARALGGALISDN
jgi:hypothetical protein